MAKRQSGGIGATKTGAASVPAEGDVWAIPLHGLGFCPMVVARTPAPGTDVPFVLAYLRPALSTTLPRPQELRGLEQWPETWISLLSLKPFQSDRWKHCGVLAGFDRRDWPVPPSRNSMVDESKPASEWSKEPHGEMWSVETTADEPTMTVIDNVRVDRDAAQMFPRTHVVNGAAHLEKGLVQYFKKRTAGFWDLHVAPQPMKPGMVKAWNNHAAKARARDAQIRHPWQPAGPRTDRTTKPGAWLGFPLCGGGFGAAMLIDRPDKSLRVFSDVVVMAMRRRWDRWPMLDDLTPLTPDDGAIVAQTSFLGVRDGRWRVLGEHPGFSKQEWTWPIPWHQSVDDEKAGVVKVAAGERAPVSVQLDPSIIALDPHAGERCHGSTSYSNLEWEVPAVMNGSRVGDNEQNHHYIGVVTPERLKAWRTINGAVRERLLARPPQ